MCALHKNYTVGKNATLPKPASMLPTCFPESSPDKLPTGKPDHIVTQNLMGCSPWCISFTRSFCSWPSPLYLIYKVHAVPEFFPDYILRFRCLNCPHIQLWTPYQCSGLWIYHGEKPKKKKKAGIWLPYILWVTKAYLSNPQNWELSSRSGGPSSRSMGSGGITVSAPIYSIGGPHLTVTY